MKLSRRRFIKAAGVAALGFMWGIRERPASAREGTDLHLLHRVTWGPRPEDVERIRLMGADAYLEEQLHPEDIDDSGMAQRLRAMPILAMNREETYSFNSGWRSYQALVEGMVAYAVHSRCQLRERMVEFWMDHFNMPGDEYGQDMIPYLREVIRPNALGSFRDLLIGTAQNSAMLLYLDNAQNVAQHPNENYARELLELHTLGVDGGYTERDVKETARAFTGWTVHDNVGFYFDTETHDRYSKSVLGHPLAEGRGIEDALEVLGLLANHPQTARFLCRKLCVRFVNDSPPESLVDGAAQVWMENGGEIKPVLRHIFRSEAFAASAGQKFRRPLEFFIAALRATGTQFGDFAPLHQMLQELAQVPYGWSPPNGYPDTAGAWMTTGGLLARWNVALGLTQIGESSWDWPYNWVKVNFRERIGNPATVGALVDAVSAQVFPDERLPVGMRDRLIHFASDGDGAEAPVTPLVLARKLAALFGLMLASPAYQWH